MPKKNLQNYFNAAYLSTQASVYFNRILFLNNLSSSSDAKVLEVQKILFKELKTDSQNVENSLLKINKIAANYNLPTLAIPDTPKEYFVWQHKYWTALLTLVEESSAEYWIMYYAADMAHWYADISILSWSLYLELNALNAPNQAEQQKKSLLSIQEYKLMLVAPALFLAKESSFYFFWEEWKHLETQINLLLGMKWQEQKKEAHVLAEDLLFQLENSYKRIFEALA